MIKAILFDFNGVIVNDEPLQMKIYKEMLRDYDIDLSDEDYYSSLGMDDSTFVRAAFDRAKKNVDDETVKTLLTRKDEMYRAETADGLPTFPGVENFVKECSRHFQLGIVSMSRRAEINAILNRMNLAGYFSTIVSAEDVSDCKPNPECYNIGFRKVDEALTAAGEFPLVREQVVVIEDSPPGIAAAKGAGLKTLGVTNTVSPETLRAAGADYVTKNLADWIPETVELVFK